MARLFRLSAALAILTDGAMSNEHQPARNPHRQTQRRHHEKPDPADSAPKTPDQIMQAATDPHRRAGGRTGGDEGPLDARRGGNRQCARPRPARGRRDARNTPCRNSPATWSRRPRTCSAASTACPPPAPGEPEIVARLREGFEGVERSFSASLERNGIKREDPTGRAVRPQPAPGDGRAGKRRRIRPAP